MNEAVERMLERYQINSVEDSENALKEVLQEIILLGLDRGDFFEKAAFYGGSALRIFNGLDRFSEDLDFTLLKETPDFKLEHYFNGVERELKAFNFDFQISIIDKPLEHRVESAFLKANTKLLFVNIKSTQRFASKVISNQKIKIKFEVDTTGSCSFTTEIKTLLLPTPFTVRVLDSSSLFAGKMHAALTRAWKGRVKGRDFYDIVWLISRNVPLNRRYLEDKLKDSMGKEFTLSKESLIELFQKRVESINWDQARQDVASFITDEMSTKIWSPEFFNELIGRITLA